MPPTSISGPIRPSLLLVACYLTLAASGQAAVLQGSDSLTGDSFGQAVTVAGNSSLIGAPLAGSQSGSAYLFRNLDPVTGIATQTAKLVPSDPAAFHAFGTSVSLFGSIGVVGRPRDSFGTSTFNQGSAYLYRGLDTATGTVTQVAKLRASDRSEEDRFGQAVSVFGNIALIGTGGTNITFQRRETAYVFRNLNTATGSVTESAKLVPSDLAIGQSFGGSVSLAGTTGLISGVEGAYVFRNLDTVTGTTNEVAKLTASDGVAVGFDVSLSANMGLLGAPADSEVRGSAYLYRDLDTATGIRTEAAKLVASDRAAGDLFGEKVALSSTTALIGAASSEADRGAAYLFQGLNSATGTVTETVKLTGSDLTAEHTINSRSFGVDVSLDGDRFVIGAYGGEGASPRSGKAYAGTVSSVTTLDLGNVSRTILGISFNSRIDWVVGDTTDLNKVTLSFGNVAEVTGAGKGVFIGRNAGSDGNILRIDGTLTSNEVHIGSLAGNTANTLQLESTAIFQGLAFQLAPENLLKIEGDFTAIDNLLTYLGNTDLEIWDGSAWQDVDSANHTGLITSSFNAGYTDVRAIPEPASLGLLTVGALLLARRRKLNRGL